MLFLIRQSLGLPCCLWTCLLLVLSPALWADGLSEDRTDELQGLADHLFEQTRAHGLSVAISEGGELVWSAHLGAAREDWHYRIGSVSKIVAAAATARMVDTGQIEWDQPVSTVLEGFPGLTDEVTFRRLANHTAGIRHYHRDEDSALRAPVTFAREALSIFADDAFSYAPGEGYEYSSYSYTLLSAALESVAEEPFDQLLETVLLGPADLVGIRPDSGNELREDDAPVYMGREHVEPLDISYKWAGGGLRAQPAALTRLAWLMTSDDEFITPEALSAMQERGVTLDGRIHPHAAGWVVDELETGEAVYFHDGDVRGGHAHLLAVPEWGLTVAIAANRSSYFSVSQGLRFLCAYRGMEQCPVAVAQASRDEQIGRGIGALQAAMGTLQSALESGDVSLFEPIVAAHFESDRWGSKDALLADLAEQLRAAPLVPQDASQHLQIGGVELGSTTRVSGLYYNRLFTAAEAMRFHFVYDGERWLLYFIDRAETE